MPDQIFENPRLVSVYDSFDGQRTDLEHYLGIVKELEAHSILDIGSGTGCFAHLLATHGFEVVALEPAQASLELARSKSYANRVRWILGDAQALPALSVDLAVMTGNVAQVFVTDQSWEENLKIIRRSLQPKGHFVFEVRDPAQKAWLEWTKQRTINHINILEIGSVESWCEVIDVAGEIVSFRWTYHFKLDDEIITSDSTIRFRSREEIELSLTKAGYFIQEVRGAPDRPGKEFVFITALA